MEAENLDIEKDKKIIEEAWENKDQVNVSVHGEIRDSVERIIALLDQGKVRAFQNEGRYRKVNDWVKKAILLYFRLKEMKVIDSKSDLGDKAFAWYDKVDSKFSDWDEEKFKKAAFRAVPGSFVRYGSYIAENVVLMPCFINIGAYVGESTMIDSWATVGACAQVGKNCHISGGAGIGGVLEPLQANPVVIEDNCFIGARSEVVEGVVVEEGSVLSMGVYIGSSTKIIDRETGEIFYGRVPAYSVVVPGSVFSKSSSVGDISLYAAVIVKRVDAKTRSKTSLNQLLRW